MKLIIASHNTGKIKEFQALFSQFPQIELTSLIDYPEIAEVEETGMTFEENARLKAETIAQQMNCLALSDDSGLVVPSLNGEPGVYSARYAGLEKNDQANIDKLLANLEGKSAQERKAYFVSCLVLSHPKVDSLVVEGRAYGHILPQVTGDQGFGYDPVFFSDEEQASFAEIPLERKNQISHRAKALAKLLEVLPDWLEEIDEP
ncbi:XTP/dITP diphosphatase [Vaginisenegalia massiliensis]|uniref:XTP/dITP diphosphatase n=1 Tax=Vaginisenegalia massiliensis TaxID=2058294 RepID=UPI000F53B0CC|nr:XTP/dITP diphosphatase [Vaginisenegalia massiliensis]